MATLALSSNPHLDPSKNKPRLLSRPINPVTRHVLATHIKTMLEKPMASIVDSRTRRIEQVGRDDLARVREIASNNPGAGDHGPRERVPPNGVNR